MNQNDAWELLLKDIGDHLKDKQLNEVDITRLNEAVLSYSSLENDWVKYAHFDKYKYTRNLVDDGNDYYNVLILCWGPGQSSPIHDHANSHCLMKILDGELQEQLYNEPKDNVPMTLERSLKLERNATTYINDSIGLHKVSNPSMTKPAISLHIYSPPIKVCRTFTPQGAARKSGNCPFYSVFGERSTVRKSGLEQ